MAIIKKNPKLPDYFSVVGGVGVGTPPSDVPCIVEQYESPLVMYFPDLRPKIDHGFWASLASDANKALKKFISFPGRDCALDDRRQDLIVERLRGSGMDDGALAREIGLQMDSILSQMLPVYRRLFAGYRFTSDRCCWRLNRINAENLHVDTYKAELPEHFARMFINLDSQPRIWHTSWRASELMEMAGRRISAQQYRELSTNDLWSAFNRSVFGKTSQEWWDDQPRHIAFFDPGDVWVVDSRLVAHQIFYGRRALTIDFVVDPGSMRDPAKHYLRIAESTRARFGGSLAAEPAAAG